ncbi:hypothetical protein C0J52_04795 [Blattella germanica]|nr:hypothetical protein C0J52_04795 [Blattella germanica]
MNMSTVAIVLFVDSNAKQASCSTKREVQFCKMVYIKKIEADNKIKKENVQFEILYNSE